MLAASRNKAVIGVNSRCKGSVLHSPGLEVMIQILPCTGGSFAKISCTNEGKQKRCNEEPISAKFSKSDDQVSIGHGPEFDEKLV
jgi:hypothetical protein